MKLLAIESSQCARYYLGRYQQVVDFGGNLHVLNGIGEPDYWPAGRYRVVGSQHIDHIVAAARAWHAEEHFDGVLTFAESAVLTVAAVAAALGLPGIGIEAARNSRNKLLMREAHERAGVPRPNFRLVPDLAAALAAGRDFGYPVVLKPTLGAGSYFVFRVNGPEEMAVRYAEASAGIGQMNWYLMEAAGLDIGPAGLLVESFLDGREYLFEALAWDDEVYLGSAVDRVTAEGDTFDDDVHVAPTTLSDAELAKVHHVVRAGAHAQGLRRSVMHAEIRFHHGEPHLLEIAARPGGGALDKVARVTADYCPIRAVMDVARGVKPRVRHYTPTGVYMMGTCLISEAGEIEYVHLPADVAEAETTLVAAINVRPGDVIRRPPDGNNILGFLVVTGTSYDDVRRTLADGAARIEVKMVGRPATGTLTPWTPAV
ncbi:MAG TPA: ATP-grasp domain-containing protein [Pseudonocardiaceae bacterium]|nr:ATP-grasp domain-containing protein [Pseudonocardiaceae bacterium]